MRKSSHYFLFCLSLLALGLNSEAAVPAKSTAKPGKTSKPGKRPPQGQFFVGGNNVMGGEKFPNLPKASEIEAMAQKLGSRQRNVDPFGIATFPREPDAVASTPDAPVRATDKITLNQALRTLKLTGVSVPKKELLIGGRRVFEGDVIMLSFRDEIFLAQVLQVGATQILFRDVKRQEAGTLPHNLIPHLELEPIQSRAQKDNLEGKVTPIETLQSQPQQ